MRQETLSNRGLPRPHMRIGRIECFVQGFWSKRLWLRLVERPKNRAGVVRKWLVSFDIIMYHQRLVAEANESFLLKRMEGPRDGNSIGHNQESDVAVREADS